MLSGEVGRAAQCYAWNTSLSERARTFPALRPRHPGISVHICPSARALPSSKRAHQRTQTQTASGMGDKASSQGDSSYDQSSLGSHGSGKAGSSVAGLSAGGVDAGVGLSKRAYTADYAFAYLGAADRLGMEKSWKLQGIILLYQVVFVAIYSIHPIWGYHFSWDNPIGRWMLRIQGHGWARVSRDERVLKGLALCALAMTVAHFLLAIRIGVVTRRGRTPHRAELVISRLFEVFYYKLFGLPALGVLLAPLSCDWSGKITGHSGHNIFLESTECKGTVLLIGLVGLAVALLLHAPMYVLLCIKDCELNPVTPVPFAGGSMAAVSRVELLKVTSLIVLHLLTGAVPVLSGVVIVLLWAWLNYVMIVRLPYLGQGQSKARAFAMGAIGCAFLASTVQVGGVNAAAILLIPISVVGGTLAILGARKRIVRAEAVLEKFKEIRKNLSQTDLRVHKFFDHEDPELLIRVLRKTEGQRRVPQEDIDGCFSAVNHAVSHFPDSAEVVMAMAIIQAYGQEDVHSAQSSVQKARGMSVSMSVRIELLSLEKELRKCQSSTGGDSMDWSSYVELQHQLRMVLQVHKKAIEASRDVWKSLLKSDLGIDDVATAVRRMDKHELAADGIYKSMISRHSNYPKLLQMYGKFLEDVLDNSGLAMQYYQEAERLEDAAAAKGEANAEEGMGASGIKDKPSLTNIDEARDSVIVIDTDGMINFTNTNLTKLLNYKRGELMGRNVSTLMPVPFSQQHDRYLKNFALTGQLHIMNKVMPMVALQKDGNLLPVTICVTKISQNGMDGYMGVIRARETNEEDAICYMTTTCQLVHATKPFSGLMGWSIQELQGTKINVIFPDEATIRAVVAGAPQECGDERPSQTVTAVQSKFGERFDATVQATYVGYGESRLVAVKVARVGEEPPLVVLGPMSEIVSYNTAFKKLCSQTEKALVNLPIIKIFAHPCSAIYATRLEKAGEDPNLRIAALDQHVVRMPSKNGIIYVQISLISKSTTDEGAPQFTMRFQHLVQGIEDHATVTVFVDKQGVITDARQHCQCTTPAFGFTREGLQGMPLNKMMLMRGPLEPFMAAWLEATAKPPFQSEPQLVSIKHAIVYFNADYGEDEEGHRSAEPTLTMTLYCLDLLNVVLEMNDKMNFKIIHGPVHRHTGMSADSLVGSNLSAILPRLAKQAGIADGLLLLPGQRKAGSNKHKSLVGQEFFSETYQGPLGIKCTCQAARMQGTKDEVLMLLEATGPSPGPAKLPVARAFIEGVDSMKRREVFGGGDAHQHGQGAAGQAEQAKPTEESAAAPALPGAAEAAVAAAARGGSSETESAQAQHPEQPGASGHKHEAPEEPGSGHPKAPSQPRPSGVGGAPTGRADLGSVSHSGGSSGEGGEDGEGAVGVGRDFASQRVRDWVDRNGSLDKMGPFADAQDMAVESLTSQAISRLQESLQHSSHGKKVSSIENSGSTQQAVHEDVAKKDSQVINAALPRDSIIAAHTEASSRPASAKVGSRRPSSAIGNLARRDSLRQDSMRLAGRSRLNSQSKPPVAKGKGDEGEGSGETVEREGHEADEPLHEDGDSGEGGEGGEDGEGDGSLYEAGREAGEDGGMQAGAGKLDKNVEEENNELARQSSFTASVMSDTARSEGQGDGGMGIVREAEDDMGGLDLLEHETAQIRGRKFKRIYALLSSQVMMRPVTVARYTMMVVSLAIIAAQAIAFALIMVRVSEYRALSTYVQKAGAAIKDIIDMKRHARLLQGLSVGTPIPGSDLQRNQELFLRKTTTFLDDHNALYHTATMFKDKKYKPIFTDIWLVQNIQVTVLTASSYTVGAQAQQQMTNLWECGNTYASYGLELAKMTEADLSQGDIAPLASFQYLKNNGLVILAGRYEELLGSLVEVSKSNLLTLGIIAVVFLAINLGVLVPVGLVLIHRAIAASLRVRAGMMSVLIATPRGLILEMSRRPVNLTMLEELAEEEQDEDSAEKNAMEVAKASGISSKAMRLLLSQKIDFDRVKVARDQVMARRNKQRTQQAVVLRVLGPFGAWAVVAGVLYGVTWALQSMTSTLLEPSRVSYLMTAYTSKTLCSTTDLVVDTINRLNGSPWATASGPVKDRLRLNQVIVQSAVDALIWGNSTFMGKYHVPGGTVVFSPTLRNIYFTHQCFSSISCVSESDPLWPSVGRGYYALMSRFSDETNALPDEQDTALTVTNSRYTFLQTQGDDSIANAQTKIRAAVQSQSTIVNTIVALHVLLLVGTITAGISYTIFLLRPLQRLLGVEALRLSHLMAELPKELAIEEAVVALVEEMVSTGQDDNLIEITGEQGASQEARDEAENSKKGAPEKASKNA